MSKKRLLPWVMPLVRLQNLVIFSAFYHHHYWPSLAVFSLLPFRTCLPLHSGFSHWSPFSVTTCSTGIISLTLPVPFHLFCPHISHPSFQPFNLPCLTVLLSSPVTPNSLIRLQNIIVIAQNSWDLKNIYILSCICLKGEAFRRSFFKHSSTTMRAIN